MQDVYWRTPNPALVLAAFIVWLCLSNVLMINLLIAMMTKSFETFEEDTHRIWLFPAATLVLYYERLSLTQVFPDKARLQVLIFHCLAFPLLQVLIFHCNTSFNQLPKIGGDRLVRDCEAR
jgi:hypothetical protein